MLWHKLFTSHSRSVNHHQLAIQDGDFVSQDKKTFDLYAYAFSARNPPKRFKEEEDDNGWTFLSQFIFDN